MPHISPAALDNLVETISIFDAHFSTAPNRIKPDLDFVLGTPITLKRIRSLDSLLFPKTVTFMEQSGIKVDVGIEVRSLCLHPFYRQFVDSAMCFAALDSCGELVVSFLVQSTAQSTLCLGPVLVHVEISCDNNLI